MRKSSNRFPIFRQKHHQFLISIQAEDIDAFKDHSEMYLRVVQFDFKVFSIHHFTTIFVNHDLTLVLRIERNHEVVYLNEDLNDVEHLVYDFRLWFQRQNLN
jgi:hypothetical protein